MLLEPLDLLVFLGYAFLIMGMGFFVSREKEGHVKDSNDYFLASKEVGNHSPANQRLDQRKLVNVLPDNHL